MISHFLSRPLRFTISVVKIGCLFHIMATHVYQIAPAAGPSMLPTFSVTGDWLLADMGSRQGRGVAVGDLVLYRIPMFAHQDGVKRVLGMPGDYVLMGTPDENGADRMIQVPRGHCWLVGDNLSASRDSRHFGPVPLALIRGRVLAKILPWRERAWLGQELESADDNP